MIHKCCQCLKIVRPEDNIEPIGEISHTYCEACYDDVMTEIKSYGEETSASHTETFGFSIDK